MASGRRQIQRVSMVGLSIFAVFAVLTLYVAVDSVSAEPPADQDYTGSKRCGSCHFEQYMKWKKDPHAKAFALLTSKYESDAKCLKCHTTGYGEATGYKDAKSDASLRDVGCESCHGPGSKHEEISKPFAQVKNLTKEQEEAVRGSIWKVLPKNICLDCHTTKAHKDSDTPPELIKK